MNPWIHDFAAYDFWAKPLGLMTLGAILKQHGLNVTYIDCLDRYHPQAASEHSNLRHGRGPYIKTSISKPAGLEDIPRTYSRYGIRTEWLQADLQAMPKPDLVLVTSLMTYWYPGVAETIAAVKRIWKDVPIILGGVYASLCAAHAIEYTGAERIIKGPGEPVVLDLIHEFLNLKLDPLFDVEDYDTYPLPAWELQKAIPYVPLLTSRGCPFTCRYCASRILHPKAMRRSPAAVVDEIRFWHNTYHIRDFAIYDDAFLVDSPNHSVPIMKQIISENLPIFFHTPNAIHIREITLQTAQLMFQCRFKTIRLGLETANMEDRKALDRKVSLEEFQQAAAYLLEAGFQRNQLGAYLLVGLPGQSLASIKASISTVKKAGLTPVMAYYSPIPGTALWPEAVASSRYNLESDPIFTNNAIFPCQKEAFSWERITYLKKLAAQ
jgi:radical SAM superfamily enzyme YgiQ (UPF0313 family)